MDDGPADFAATQRMLLAACESGVGHLAAIVHATPGREVFPTDEYLARLDMARRFCRENGLPLQIHQGCEIFYTDEAPRLLQQGLLPTLGGGRYVLVEFAWDASFDAIARALRALGNAGFSTVVAHAERYRTLRSLANVEQLRQMQGVRIQVNCNTIVGKKSLAVRWWVRQMLRRGLIDLVASDAHNTSSRPCQMAACYQALAATRGENTARQLCIDHPLDILQAK